MARQDWRTYEIRLPGSLEGVPQYGHVVRHTTGRSTAMSPEHAATTFLRRVSPEGTPRVILNTIFSKLRPNLDRYVQEVGIGDNGRVARTDEQDYRGGMQLEMGIILPQARDGRREGPSYQHDGCGCMG